MVTISAPFKTLRPSDNLVTMASGLAGGASFAEVLDLVDRHMPEIDTSRTRMIQRMPVRPCTEKPHFPLAAADDE